MGLCVCDTCQASANIYGDEKARNNYKKMLSLSDNQRRYEIPLTCTGLAKKLKSDNTTSCTKIQSTGTPALSWMSAGWLANVTALQHLVKVQMLGSSCSCVTPECARPRGTRSWNHVTQCSRHAARKQTTVLRAASKVVKFHF